MRSLPRRVVPPVLLALGLVLGLTLAPGAAYARSWHHKDGHNDVDEIVGCIASGARVASFPAPARCRPGGSRAADSTYDPNVAHPTADARRVGVTYTDRRITLTARLADMAPHADSGLGWLVETKAADGLLVAVSWRGGGAHLSLSTLTGAPVTCHGTQVTTQPKRGAFKATLPAACVHRSPWVKVGLRTQARDQGNCYIDDALEADFDPFQVGQVGYGPKVRRG